MAAYYLNSPHIWLLAHEAKNRAKNIVATNPDAPAVDAIAAILLAAAASEGFINEVSEICAAERPNNHLPTSLVTFGKHIQGMEQARAATLEKYEAGAFILNGTSLDRGRNPYQDFDLLFRVRNHIIHLKAIDQAGPQRGGKGTYTMPKIVRQLRSRNLVRQVKKGCGASWFDALETDRMASWACSTAINMILAVLDMIPDIPEDPTNQLKQLFRRYRSLM